MQGHEAWNWGSSNLVMQRSLELLAFREVMRDEVPTDGRVEGWRDCGLWSPHGLSYETGHTWCYYWPWSFHIWTNFGVQSLSRARLCDPMDGSTPGFPVLHHLLELVQTHVHWVSDAIQPSCPLSSPSPPAFNLSQHQSLFQWVSSSHQLEFELQHQSFQWIFRTDLL